MPKVGLEPTQLLGYEILSLMCLPFHHSGVLADKLFVVGIRRARGVARNRFQINKSANVLSIGLAASLVASATLALC